MSHSLGRNTNHEELQGLWSWDGAIATTSEWCKD